MSLHFLRYVVHFFDPPQIMVLINFLELKLHRGVIQVGFRGQKDTFLASRNFFSKNQGKISAKRKNGRKWCKKPKNGFIQFPDIVCNYFYYSSSSNGPKKPFSAVFGHFLAIFGHFWCTPKTSQSTQVRTSEIHFSLQILKIQVKSQKMRP